MGENSTNYSSEEIHKQKYDEYRKHWAALSAERQVFSETLRKVEKEFCFTALCTDESKEVMKQILTEQKDGTISNINRIYLDSVLVRNLRYEEAGYDKEKMRYSYKMIHYAIHGLDIFREKRVSHIGGNHTTNTDSTRNDFLNAPKTP